MNIVEGLSLLKRVDWQTTREPPAVALEWWSKYLLTTADLSTVLREGERYPNFVKYRIAETEADGPSVRLHYFSGHNASGSLHSHRWPFWAMLLTGSYVHRIYALNAVGVARVDPNRPLFATVVEGRAPYGLDPDVIHQVETRGSALSLVLRGPVQRESRFIQLVDGQAGRGQKYEMFESVQYPQRLSTQEASALRAEVQHLVTASMSHA